MLNLTGQKYGRLTILDEALPALSNGHRDRRWNCLCDCGTQKVILQGSFRSGKTVSCGCFHEECMKSPYDTDSPEYAAWLNMKARCNPTYRKNEACYQRKQLGVCDHWLNDFQAFLDHVGPRPSPSHSIDRIDNSNGYLPGNVRWATKQEQSRNRDCAIWLTFCGERLHLAEWAKRTGLLERVIYRRVKVNGWTVEKALTTPILVRHPKST